MVTSAWEGHCFSSSWLTRPEVVPNQALSKGQRLTFATDSSAMAYKSKNFCFDSFTNTFMLDNVVNDRIILFRR